MALFERAFSFRLKCRDESGIAAYYFGKTQPVSKDDIVNNTATDITATTSKFTDLTIVNTDLDLYAIWQEIE